MVTLKEIEAYRKANKLTKKDLAAKLGMSYVFFVKVMNGHRPLSPALCAKFENIARAVGVKTYRDVIAVPVRFTLAEWAALKDSLPEGTDIEEHLRAYVMGDLLQQAEKEIGQGQ